MEMSRVERKKREKSQPKRSKLEKGLVTLRASADFSRVATYLTDWWDKLEFLK